MGALYTRDHHDYPVSPVIRWFDNCLRTHFVYLNINLMERGSGRGREREGVGERERERKGGREGGREGGRKREREKLKSQNCFTQQETWRYEDIELPWQRGKML